MWIDWTPFISTIVDMIYDVIIIGGGPAGSTLGYDLTVKGFDVLIIEKEKFPRYKVCAGGVPLILKDLIGDFPYERMFDTVLLMKGGRSWRLHLTSPIATVRRPNFDNYLLNRAKKAGVRIRFETVNEIKDDKVLTNKRSYRTRIIVGADGAFSLVRRTMGIRFRRWVNTVEWEISGSTDQFLVAIGPGPGYAWSWPKRNTIAFGGGGFGKPEQWALRLAQGLGIRPENSGYHYRYPLWEKGLRAKDNMILIGDAGAFASPLTGAGIYTGIISALAASKMITRYLKYGGPFADPYFRSLYQELIPPSRLAPVLFTLPPVFINFSKRAVGRSFGEIQGYQKMIRSLWRSI